MPELSELRQEMVQIVVVPITGIAFFPRINLAISGRIYLGRTVFFDCRRQGAGAAENTPQRFHQVGKHFAELHRSSPRDRFMNVERFHQAQAIVTDRGHALAIFLRRAGRWKSQNSAITPFILTVKYRNIFSIYFVERWGVFLLLQGLRMWRICWSCNYLSPI